MMSRLKLITPQLVKDSLAYYEKAKELHQDNEPEERDHYIRLAEITWQTATHR